MSRARRALAVTAVAVAAGLGSAEGQGYRLRLDSRFQSVAYRGATVDSVLATDVVTGPTGGLETSDGFAVSCRPGDAYCRFFRAGPVQRGAPLVTTADLSVWGFGVPGLSVRTTARVGVDVGTSDVWPGTDPAVQLLEGVVEYASDLVTAQAGRTHEITRFGFVGFDGGKVTLRALGGKLAGTAYGGWGLARGVALPVTSPALNPLDDFQPRDRQLVVGGDLAWSMPRFRGTVAYQREVDPGSDYFVSERGGFDLALGPAAGFTLTGGADYDFANDWWGSAEVIAGYTMSNGLLSGSIGARRYRPHFPLWTIWGAFSPVPYRAAFGSLSIVPIDGLELRARGEVYEFDDADAATPLVDAEDSGWRWSAGGTFAAAASVVINAVYHVEFGPGASSLGFRGNVTWLPVAELRLTGHLARLERPLEFRFNDSNVWMYGLDADYRVGPRLETYFALALYDEVRDRPDAAAFDWNQLRVNAGLRVLLGAGEERAPGFHPAILRIPERPAEVGNR